MFQHHNSSSIAPPPSNYSHEISGSGINNWLYISGQIGIDCNKKNKLKIQKAK